MNKTKERPHVWGRLAAFDHPKPAEALTDFLLQRGFVARVYDERKLQRFWFLTRPLAGVCVQVPEETLPAARDFLLAHLIPMHLGFRDEKLFTQQEAVQ